MTQCFFVLFSSVNAKAHFNHKSQSQSQSNTYSARSLVKATKIPNKYFAILRSAYRFAKRSKLIFVRIVVKIKCTSTRVSNARIRSSLASRYLLNHNVRYIDIKNTLNLLQAKAESLPKKRYTYGITWNCSAAAGALGAAGGAANGGGGGSGGLVKGGGGGGACSIGGAGAGGGDGSRGGAGSRGGVGSGGGGGAGSGAGACSCGGASRCGGGDGGGDGAGAGAAGACGSGGGGSWFTLLLRRSLT
ncbi:keratin, type II cytoskeletal 2 epidermal-like [Hydractinia symbiolongicarpus]|uniref:keratin, type II cytoskeletal 2 epidermal-like n=1 Tax=Hydractinia symbiolongicarpus TaxID=13093 RepID=UPI00254D0985|nr:keratin, type II cytoskeletal 2 epidermal-like [Hydractinia symbiolongicarpus]